MTDAKNAEKFNCKICNFNCSKESNYNKHILTLKHQNTYKYLLKNAENAVKNNFYICQCGKEYKHRQSLFNHKKICNIKNYESKNNLVEYLIKENAEIKNMILDVCKNFGNLQNNNNSFNTNSHNKTFNLNLFLNETCKDAMNITDFVDTVKLQLSDLEKVGEIGYVNGISNIIVKNLNALDIDKRPVHCTDTKREILYIKDDNKWEKENEGNLKIRKVIKKVADKNARLLPEFKAKYPDCVKYSSPYSDQYNKLIIEAMGGSGDNNLEKEDKIIRKIAKEVVIDKKNY
jgi:hypothetical protein